MCLSMLAKCPADSCEKRIWFRLATEMVAKCDITSLFYVRQRCLCVKLHLWRWKCWSCMGSPVCLSDFHVVLMFAHRWQRWLLRGCLDSNSIIRRSQVLSPVIIQPSITRMQWEHIWLYYLRVDWMVSLSPSTMQQNKQQTQKEVEVLHEANLHR